MTHDSRFTLRFRSHPAFFSAAVVYDFIPWEWPGYMETVPSRIYHLAKMGRLRNFDFFLPISDYTAWGLTKWLGVSRERMSVTGASVRQSIYEFRESSLAESTLSAQTAPYFVIVIAADNRKNPDVAVKAVRHLNLLYGSRVVLKVIGHYEDAQKRHLLKLAGHAEGSGFLEFCPAISDEELVSLYAGAVATIAPSHIEGFSLPVVEAAVCGCPVIASTCAAHMELVDRPEALFPSHDSAVLVEKLEGVLQQPSLRASLIKSQAHLSSKFHEEQVGRRFWSSIEAATAGQRRAPAISKSRKPHLAFLSPYPPDRSGAASYTAMTLQASGKLFTSDLYTDAPRPLNINAGSRDVGNVSVAPLVKGAYDGVISVLGDSRVHNRIFEIFEQFGGPCILHDSTLIRSYIDRLGPAGFPPFSASLAGRPISIEEAESWRQERHPPSLLLDVIVKHASPLIVHTATQQAEIKKRYGVDAHVTTCCPTVLFSDEELTETAMQAARARCGIAESAFLISSFGPVAPEKGMETAVLAIEILRSWKIPAQLHFVGDGNSHAREVQRMAALYGVAGHIQIDEHFISDSVYRDFLLASDASLQLRAQAFGQLSTALTDVISAALPGVATNNMAESCEAPDYISTVPDQFSPLQVAEQLAAIWERRPARQERLQARAAYLETHNFQYYGQRLMEILGIS